MSRRDRVPLHRNLQPDRRQGRADWLHEVKFDGYRVQAPKVGKDVVIFSRNGHEYVALCRPHEGSGEFPSSHSAPG